MSSVARSTTEAEYVGANESVKKLIWLRRLAAELEGKDYTKQAAPMLLGDNKAAVQLALGLSNTANIKHIDIAFHHIVDEVNKGQVKVSWIPGNRQLADGLTKALDKAKFEANRYAIGVERTVQEISE